jgi:hypothetical protein
MGILFTPRPKLAYVPPAAPTLPAAPSRQAGRSAVIRDLPGLGRTYLDSEFAPKVDSFIENARRQGVNLVFESGYRTLERNQELVNNPGKDDYPAVPQSLHRAGLAVDVRYKGQGDAVQKIIRDAADAAGLSWGGKFVPPYIVHFYFDPNPGADRTSLISDFDEQVRKLSPAQPRGLQ